MKKFALVLFAAGLAVGCDKNTDEENALNLEGAWSQPCRADNDSSGNPEKHTKMRLEFDGGTLSVIINKHGASDTSCQTIDVETVYTGNYVTGADADHQTEVEGASPLDLTMTSIRITPKTAEGLTALNTDTFCDKSDWALDTATEFTTASGCSDLANRVPPPPTLKWHQIFKADADNVYFGATQNSANDGSTAEKAPVELDSEPFTRAG